MKHLLTLLFCCAFTANLFATEAITIFVKEKSYSIDRSEVELTAERLENELEKLAFMFITLDVDYCAGPDTLAYAYVAIENVNPSVKEITLKLSGSHEKSVCSI
jgi:hypothetical protein